MSEEIQENELVVESEELNVDQGEQTEDPVVDAVDNAKRFTKYFIWTFALAWVMQVVASVFSWKGNTIVFQLVLAVSMYAPFVGTLLAGIPLRGMGWIPRFRGNILAIFAAWIGPIVLTVLGAVLYFLIFPSRLDFTGKYLVAAGGEAVMEQLSAAGITPELYLVIALIQCITYAPFVNMFVALGEEVGWRGAMQPILKQRFGLSKGRVIGGVIWGAWHWPVMTMAGYEYGLEYWGYPVLGMVLFCLFAVVAGTLIDALYEKTGCIWVPALAHGSVNAIATVPMMVGGSEYLDQMILGPAPMGIISMIPMLIVAVWVLVKK